jgi:uncharacterized membrane protein
MIQPVFLALWAHGGEDHAEKAAEVAKAVNYGLVTLHPIAVHLPIGLLVAALVFELLFIWRQRMEWRFASRAVFILGGLGAVVALGSGFLADNELGHGYAGHDLAHTHRNIMIATTGVWFIAILAAIKFRTSFDRVRFLHIIVYGLTAALLFFGAHIGGELVYEHGVGVNVNPEKTPLPNR